MPTQLQFSIVADADPKAVETLTNRMDSLADSARRAHEEVNILIRDLSMSTSSGLPAGPGAFAGPVTGGGLATAIPNLDATKQYSDRAQYIGDVANKMKSEFQVVQQEMEKVGKATGQTRASFLALRAAMHQLTAAIPGLSQAMQAFHYGGASFGVVTTAVTLLTTQLQLLISAWNDLQNVVNRDAIGGAGQFSIAGQMKNAGEMVLGIAKATKEWEMSLQGVHAQLQAVATVQGAVLDVEHKRAQRHLEIDKAVGRVTAAQEVVRSKDIEVQDRQRRLMEADRAAKAEEEAQRQKLGPAAGRTVEEQQAIAIEAETNAKTLRERIAGAEAGLRTTEASVASEQSELNQFAETPAPPQGITDLPRYARDQYRTFVLGNARRFNSLAEYRKVYAEPGASFEGDTIRQYFARLERVNAGREQAKRLRDTLNAARSALGPAEVSATEERARATMLPGYQSLLTQNRAAAQARRIEEEEAQKHDLADLYAQLRQTPEGADFEGIYNSYREGFRQQRLGRGAMSAEDIYGAQELMFRMTGRRLGFGELEGAYSADPTSERYQRMVVSGAGALMTREQRLQQQSEFQYSHPFNAVGPRDPREARFDAALRSAQSASANVQVFVTTVGTYLQGVLTFQEKLQRKIEELERQAHTRAADALIPHTQ